jgi:ABC-type transport system involved in multi-copper enzyme maturation permease subunit
MKARSRKDFGSSSSSLIDVAAWELRRLAASPSNFAIVGVIFALFAGLVWVKHTWAVPVETGAGRGVVLTVLGSTALGTVFEVVALLLLFFGMLVPFVVADAVARDHRQRVHELLMATPISTSAYVWGRFLASTAVALILSIVMLIAVAAADLLIHMTEPGFPITNGGGLALTWAVLVAPAVVVIGALSFMLSTLLPRLATPAKVAVVLFWVMLSLVVDIGHGLGGFGYWTPTGNGVLKVLPQAAAERYSQILANGAADPTAAALQVQQQIPDLAPWAGPHLGLVILGAIFVAITMIGFQRFKNALA